VRPAHRPTAILSRHRGRFRSTCLAVTRLIGNPRREDIENGQNGTR
jgi:hypothetical protein